MDSLQDSAILIMYIWWITIYCISVLYNIIMICVWVSINNNNNIYNQITLHGHAHKSLIGCPFEMDADYVASLSPSIPTVWWIILK